MADRQAMAHSIPIPKKEKLLEKTEILRPIFWAQAAYPRIWLYVLDTTDPLYKGPWIQL